MARRKPQARAAMEVGCAAKLRILADPTRLRVLELLMAGPRRVGELNASLALDQSLLSHHLATLRAAGLVLAQRAGKGVLYRLAPTVQLPAPRAAIDLGCCQLTFDPEARAGAPLPVSPARKVARAPAPHAGPAEGKERR